MYLLDKYIHLEFNSKHIWGQERIFSHSTDSRYLPSYRRRGASCPLRRETHQWKWEYSRWRSLWCVLLRDFVALNKTWEKNATRIILKMVYSCYQRGGGVGSWWVNKMSWAYFGVGGGLNHYYSNSLLYQPMDPFKNQLSRPAVPMQSYENERNKISSQLPSSAIEQGTI